MKPLFDWNLAVWAPDFPLSNANPVSKGAKFTSRRQDFEENKGMPALPVVF